MEKSWSEDYNLNQIVKKVGTPRRRCPKHQARRADSGIQWRLQPSRCATTAWQARARETDKGKHAAPPVSQTSGAPRRLWDAKAPPTFALRDYGLASQPPLRDYGLASQARETDGDGAPIFTPEFPKADPYHFLEILA